MTAAAGRPEEVASANSSPYLPKIVSKAPVLRPHQQKNRHESGGMKSALV
jgi:hypothetical protein